MRGNWFALKANQWFFNKKETEKISGQIWLFPEEIRKAPDDGNIVVPVQTELPKQAQVNS